MNSTQQLLERQNLLLEQQNALLRELRENQKTALAMAPVEHQGARRMMTEHDLLLIVMADDVLQAVDRWNRRRA